MQDFIQRSGGFNSEGGPTIKNALQNLRSVNFDRDDEDNRMPLNFGTEPITSSGARVGFANRGTPKGGGKMGANFNSSP